MSVDPTASAKERNDCLRKKRYKQDRAHRQVAKLGARGKAMRCYRCPWCGGWHLASVKVLP